MRIFKWRFWSSYSVKPEIANLNSYPGLRKFYGYVSWDWEKFYLLDIVKEGVWKLLELFLFWIDFIKSLWEQINESCFTDFLGSIYLDLTCEYFPKFARFEKLKIWVIYNNKFSQNRGLINFIVESLTLGWYLANRLGMLQPLIPANLEILIKPTLLFNLWAPIRLAK